jgi:hypothetical protein
MSGEIFQVRASSLGTLFDCSMRWEGEHLIRLQRATSLRAWLGTSIHASTAAFDQAKLSGAPISANEAADVFVSTLWDPSEEVDFKDPKLSMKQAELIGLTLHARYCAEIAPMMNFESVEMPLKPLDVAAEGVIIRLTGTMDRARVARASGKKVIADLKTGGRPDRHGWRGQREGPRRAAGHLPAAVRIHGRRTDGGRADHGIADHQHQQGGSVARVRR